VSVVHTSLCQKPAANSIMSCLGWVIQIGKDDTTCYAGTKVGIEGAIHEYALLFV